MKGWFDNITRYRHRLYSISFYSGKVFFHTFSWLLTISDVRSSFGGISIAGLTIQFGVTCRWRLKCLSCECLSIFWTCDTMLFLILSVIFSVSTSMNCLTEQDHFRWCIPHEFEVYEPFCESAKPIHEIHLMINLIRNKSTFTPSESTRYLFRHSESSPGTSRTEFLSFWMESWNSR
jgi:hypothetical protein